jgi:hypothetical protein
VLDHNDSDSNPSVNNTRIAKHAEFLTQVNHKLDELKSSEKTWIHFLINKHDLWSTAIIAENNLFVQFYTDQVQKWKLAKRAVEVSYQTHSNKNPDDIARFMNELIKHVKDPA